MELAGAPRTLSSVVTTSPDEGPLRTLLAKAESISALTFFADPEADWTHGCRSDQGWRYIKSGACAKGSSAAEKESAKEVSRSLPGECRKPPEATLRPCRHDFKRRLVSTTWLLMSRMGSRVRRMTVCRFPVNKSVTHRLRAACTEGNLSNLSWLQRNFALVSVNHSPAPEMILAICCMLNRHFHECGVISDQN